MEQFISSMTLQIRYCRQFSHSAPWHQSKTWPDYTLYYIREGVVSIQVKGTAHTAKPGDVILLFPGDYGTMTAEEDCRFLLACFRMDVGNYHHLFHHLNSAGVYPGSSLSQAGETLCRAFPEGQNPLRFSLRQYAAFTVFLAELIACSGIQTPFYRPAPQYSDRKLNHLLHYMDTHAPEVPPIRELAAKMGMSEKYFIQYFHRQIGCSPGQYRNRQRMYYASELLSDESLTLNEIAQKLHYSDQYSFSKAFRKYYGESPGTFRSHLK